MTLREFAVVVGAETKWVLNARILLERKFPYTVTEARQLGLARILQHALGTSLKRSHRMAGRALAGGRGPAALEVDDIVTVTIDLSRYLSNFLVRLSRSRTHDPSARRGRPPRRSHASAIERARRYGIDIDLMRARLRLTAAERLRLLDRDATFVESLARGRHR